jgi:hypothetical protein
MNDDLRAVAERKRLYNLGALAQSYPPRGVADLVRRPPSRPAWRARPVRERIAICAVLTAEAPLAGVVIVGVATRSVGLVLAGAGAFLILLLGTAAVTVRSELKRVRSDVRRARDDG